ncbi:hypothetical protein M378DRAFT_187786 [Amanita muscaria Koide BX008]|uniref:Uncharacterized protein n=1 Tax=Amanita muscaria (strain Koide BX008) TaxID=946122 RepID=A0A0C2WUH7_AMAMK|nr:hypothetical protein M378DRAFT_187786 [Amanita muscaria Koide BX008]
MEKLSSIIAALNAGKLPTTQQFVKHNDWLENFVLLKVEESSQEMAEEFPELTAQGKILADDIMRLLEAYKAVAMNKNHDNILQEAIWNLCQSDLKVSLTVHEDIERTKKDLEAIRSALRTIVSVIWTNISTEGTALMQDFVSFARLALADTAGLVEEMAGRTKEGLREQERGYQEGERDVLGREKKRLEEETDIKVAWEHGMETVKETGASVIDTTRSAKETAEEKAESTTSRIKYAYEQILERAQNDPAFKQSLNTVFDVIQRRLNQTLDAAADPNVTLESFIQDPTEEKHVHNALKQLCVLLERFAHQPFQPLFDDVCTLVQSITSDEGLRQWFNDFFDLARKNLGEPGYAQSEESRKAREKLGNRWNELLEGNLKFKSEVDQLKKDFESIQQGIDSDKDLIRLRAAHEQLSRDIQRGLSDVGAEGGIQGAIEQATWFWQDLFRVYMPRVLASLKDVPIPRTEYKDNEIEFVLENMDISSFSLHPSHVYIRNITDVDISTSSPQATTKMAMGALTHIRVQAVRLALDDVSFWYRDKTATIGPSEFTGLMTVMLPEKGVDVDMKIRLIPATTKGPHSREALKHFHTIDKLEVKISDEIGLEVKESDHPIMLTLFKPLMVARLRSALEKAFAEQLRALIEWVDGIAYDIGERMQVFEDTGLPKGPSFMTALWSEIGRLQRESAEAAGELGVHATRTGVVVERYEMTEGGERERKAAFAIGAEPQILSGEKHGPLGTGSESLSESMEEVRKRAEGMVKAGRRQIRSFRRSMEMKTKEEEMKAGWQSDAFELE